MNENTDHIEGYADGIAGHALQPRAGHYLAGFADGALDRIAMLLRQALAIVAPKPAPLPFELPEDE